MILKNLTKDFTTIPNKIIIDSNLSAGAFRLYCYLASKPETWEVNNTDIRKQLGVGKDALAKYWKELKENGWIEKEQEKDEKGKFTGKTILILHNSRIPKNTEIGKSPNPDKDGNPKKSESGKSRTHSNTDIYNNTDYSSNTEYNKKNNNTTSEKFTIESALKKSNIQQLLNELKVDSAFVYELEYHLKTLNKPIVNEKMLIALLRDIRDASIKLKRSANEILEFMQIHGWKSIKSEWIENVESVKSKKSKKSKKTKSSSLKELEKFGFKFDDEIIDTPLIGGWDG